MAKYYILNGFWRGGDYNMQVTWDCVINDIFLSDYKDSTGQIVVYHQLEISNPDFRSKFDRNFYLSVDNDCWNRLDLKNKSSLYKGKPIRLVLKPFGMKTGVGLSVLDIKNV